MAGMTSRERWLAVLRRETPDRIPMDYWATPETTRKLLKHLGCSTEEEMFQQLGIDRPFIVKPAYHGPPVPPGYDMYGCGYQEVDYGTGFYPECVYHPLAQYGTVEEIEARYTWPSPDWFDYAALKEQVRGHEHRPIQGGGSEPFLKYAEMRGLEQSYIDLVENPELVTYCLDRLFNFSYADR